MRRIVWEASARRDYRAAIGFVAGHDASAARSLRRKIDDAVGSLSRHAVGRPSRIV